MAVVTRTVGVPAERVFAVLADGWRYSDWVVGTAHIRDVDDGWPAIGTRIHHTVGPWPVSLNDTSTVEAMTPDRRLRLVAGLWPLGEATVDIALEPLGDGATRVTLHEDFRGGPLLWVWNKVNDLILHGRNREALRRLADLAEAGR